MEDSIRDPKKNLVNDFDKIISTGKEVIRVEAEAVSNLFGKINNLVLPRQWI
jgi:hypothetical protein